MTEVRIETADGETASTGDQVALAAGAAVVVAEQAAEQAGEAVTEATEAHERADTAVDVALETTDATAVLRAEVTELREQLAALVAIQTEPPPEDVVVEEVRPDAPAPEPVHPEKGGGGEPADGAAPSAESPPPTRGYGAKRWFGGA